MSSTTPRRRLVGVSTKMYFSAARTKQYVADVLALLSSTSSSSSASSLSNTDVFIIPDHVTLASVVAQLQSASAQPVDIMVGAQDASSEDSGAYTGSVSPAVLAEVGCRILEVGHAERRRLFGETDADAARKAAAATRNGLVPLVCIGERRSGAMLSAAVGECAAQVDAVMAAVPDGAEVVLAYEPVWAIGAAEPASVEHVAAVVAALRELPAVKGRAGPVRIIYGGSAGPGLFEKLKDSTDGLFLGRFGHDPAAFVKTIYEVANA